MRSVVGTARKALFGGLLLAVFGSFGGGGCAEKDSLIVVTASTATTTTLGLHTLVVSAGGTVQSFQIADDIAYGVVKVGLYVPSSLTGSVNVKADAVSLTGCGPGYAGSMVVRIPSAGSTVEADIIMDDAPTCPPNSGSGGTSGRGGSSGSGGTGGTTGPTVSTCTEVDHLATGTCAGGCTIGGTADVAVFGVAFSPTNPQLVVTGGGDGRVKVWTIGATGTLTAQGTVLSGMGVSVVAFSPDGSTLAIGRKGGVDLVNVATWTVNPAISPVLPGTGGSTFGVGFSPDGQQIIALGVTLASSGSGTTGTLASYTVGSTQPSFTASITNAYALAVSPVSSGGSLPVAVTTTDGNMEVFNLTAAGFSAPATVTVTSNASYAETATFSPPGTVLASGGDDGFVSFWPLPVLTGAAEDGSPIDIGFSTLDSTQVWGAGYSPDGAYIAVGGGGFFDNVGVGSLTIWNAAAPRDEASGEYDTSNGYDVISVAYSPSGNLIVAGEGDCGCVVVCPQ